MSNKSGKGAIGQRDCETIVLKRKPTKDEQARSGTVEAVRKRDGGTNTHSPTANLKKLDAEELPVVEKVSHDLSKQIQNARTGKGWTQKELAQKLNITPRVIQDYENGKAIPDGQLLANMSRLLGVKLKK